MSGTRAHQAVVRAVVGLALAAGGALVWSGCAGGLSVEATDACTRHAAWVAAGRPESRADLITARLTVTSLPDEPQIAGAVARLGSARAAGDEAAFSRASAALAEACRAGGWEPPEG